MTKEIETIDDIKVLVDSFYAKVREDELLKDIFENVIQGKWEQHLEKIYRFWQTILLGEQTYSGSPFMHHAKLPVESKHFDRWVKLFVENIDEQFTGAKAVEAKMRARSIALIFLDKIEYIKNYTFLNIEQN